MCFQKVTSVILENNLIPILHFLTVRLVDGDSPYSGRFEAYIHNYWRPIMVTQHGWARNVADLLCRSMGFDLAIEALLLQYNGSSVEASPFKLESVECDPDAADFFECTYTVHSGSEQLFAAGLSCQGNPHSNSYISRVPNDRSINEYV